MTDKYEICIEGHLSPHWSEWLGGFNIINLDTGETLLLGLVRDQPALQDLLAKIRDLNLVVVSLHQLDDQ